MHTEMTKLLGLNLLTAAGKTCEAGTTLLTGKSPVCPDCGHEADLDIFAGKSSPQGWGGHFIGSRCGCTTIYTRESWLLRSRTLAEITLRVFNETGVLYYKREAE